MAKAHPNAVVLICDQRFLPAAYFVAKQVLDHSRQNFDLILQVVDTEGILPAPPDSRIKIQSLAIDPALVAAVGPSAGSGVAYGRLLLGRLRNSYERVLYLDSDLWIAGTDIGRVFSTNLGPHAFAAVRDHIEVLGRDNASWLKYKERIGLPATKPYFNSGVMLIDPERFASERIGERAAEYVKAGEFVGSFHDQSALNAVMQGAWLELSPRWNWTFTTRQSSLDEFGPTIVHFVGSHKPWNDADGRYAASYARELDRNCRDIGFPNFVARRKFWPAYWRQCKRSLTNILIPPSTTRNRLRYDATSLTEAFLPIEPWLSLSSRVAKGNPPHSQARGDVPTQRSSGLAAVSG